MKKTFSLRHPGKADARVADAVKHEVKKYLRRDARQPLPEGLGWRDHLCRVGPDAASAVATPLTGISAAIDTILHAGGVSVYVEILPDHKPRPIRYVP